MGLCSQHREQCHHREISQQITMADAAEEAKQKEALNGQLKEYIAEWRKTREKEEEELKKRRSALKKLRPSVKRCLRLRRLPMVVERRSLLLEALPMMPAEKCPRPKNSWKRKRKLPLASESNPLSLKLWTLMSSKLRPMNFSTILLHWRLTNMIMSRGS